MRIQWNRAFALLTIIVVLSGVSSVIGARLLIDSFRDSAVRVEREATISVQLRADIVAHVIAITTTPPTAQDKVDGLQSAVRAGFAKANAVEGTPRARSFLNASLVQWQQLVAAAGSSEDPAGVAARGAAVATSAPKILGLLDEAGTASRAAVRNDLANAARLDRLTMAVLVLLQLLAIGLAVRLARRLSTEVLRPVGVLRDTANSLAKGQLDQRIVVDRADELGELAADFNAMADAIAGTHRGLQLEAKTDSLTGLANRPAFHAALADTLSRPKLRGGTQAVLFVDLDDFKDVNDTLGHAAGDELLRVAAARLSAVVRPGDLVARLGGDEFALLLDGLADVRTAEIVAERVVATLADEVEIGPHMAHVGASVGLAMRQPNATCESFMREADIAMYAAKGKGKNRVETYDAGLDAVVVPRQVLRPDAAGDRVELV